MSIIPHGLSVAYGIQWRPPSDYYNEDSQKIPQKRPFLRCGLWELFLPPHNGPGYARPNSLEEQESATEKNQISVHFRLL